MRLADSLQERLQNCPPLLSRVLFGLSLLGVLIVAHLFIQHDRSFDRGCFGFSSLDAAEQGFNCSAVLSSSVSQFFGISNLVWGLGFYLLVAGLTAALFWVQPRIRKWVHGSRVGLLTVGFGYSVYLSYIQAVNLESFCALCLASAAVVTLLFGTQVLILTKQPSSTETPMSSQVLKRELSVYVYLIALAAVLIGADVTYFSGLDQETQSRSATEQTTRATTAQPEPGGGDDAQCQLDTTKQPVPDDGASLVRFQDIIKGNSDADVTVVEYFDPNCPHCKTFHETMKQVVAQYQDEVRFVYKPFPLQQASLPEIQALYVAAQAGKFTEMLEGQYARQGQTGISNQDLRSIASEIGMNPDVLLSRLEKNQYRDQVVEMRKRAIEIGVDSTPTVLVNGHFVRNRSLECLQTFIDQAQQGTLGQTTEESE